MFIVVVENENSKAEERKFSNNMKMKFKLGNRREERSDHEDEAHEGGGDSHLQHRSDDYFLQRRQRQRAPMQRTTMMAMRMITQKCF